MSITSCHHIRRRRRKSLAARRPPPFPCRPPPTSLPWPPAARRPPPAAHPLPPAGQKKRVKKNDGQNLIGKSTFLYLKNTKTRACVRKTKMLSESKIGGSQNAPCPPRRRRGGGGREGRSDWEISARTAGFFFSYGLDQATKHKIRQYTSLIFSHAHHVDDHYGGCSLWRAWMTSGHHDNVIQYIQA